MNGTILMGWVPEIQGVLEASLRNGLNTKIEIEGRVALLWTFSKV